jgi:hypothetical protein
MPVSIDEHEAQIVDEPLRAQRMAEGFSLQAPPDPRLRGHTQGGDGRIFEFGYHGEL